MKERFSELMKKGHVIRKFHGKHISDETIDQILSLASTFVPTWIGCSVEFIVIRDRKMMSALSKCKATGVGPLAYGDAAIVPVIDKRGRGSWAEDAAIVSASTLHAAEHYGIAAYVIYMKDRRGYTKVTEDDIRDLLDIPDYYGILNMVSLGMTDNTLGERDLQSTIHYEKFGSKK